MDLMSIPESVTLFNQIRSESALFQENEGETNNTPVIEIFLEYITLYCLSNCLRRKGDSVYEPVYTERGYHTRCFQEKCSIESMIWTLSTQEKMIPHLLRNTQTIRDIVSFFLKDTPAFKNQTRFSKILPHIEENRDYISWKNGIHYLPYDIFYPYDSSQPPTSSIIAAEQIPPIDPLLVTCTFQDKEFVHQFNIDWHDIKVAHDNILFHQHHYVPVSEDEIPEDTKKYLKKENIAFYIDKQGGKFSEPSDDTRPVYNFTESGEWAYALMGRSLFWLKQMDDWPVTIFFIGYAGTGKTSLVNSIASLYPIQKVGIIANKTEEKWSLAGCDDKDPWYVLICPEMQRNANWNQGEFMQCSGGEIVELKSKFKNKKPIRWRTPILMAGNEMIKTWRDVAQNLFRRTCVLDFRFYVNPKDSSPNLLKELENDLPLFVQKCVRAYLDSVMLYRHKNLTDVFPKNIIEATTNAVSSTNPFSRFFNEPSLFSVNPNYQEKYTDFKKIFLRWCLNKGLATKFIKFSEEDYQPVFDQFGIKLETQRDESDVRRHHIQVLKGIKFTDQALDLLNDEIPVDPPQQ